MPPFGRERFRIESPLPPDEVAARMAAAVEPVRWVRWPFEPPGRPFEGEAGPTEFRVCRVTSRRKSLRVEVEGRVAWVRGGSVVDGTMALAPLPRFFAAVWLGFAGLLAVGCLWMFVRDGLNGDWHPVRLVAVGVVAGGWMFWAGLFRVEMGRSLAGLREVVGADHGIRFSSSPSTSSSPG